MVWEVKTQSVPQRVQEIQTQSSGMDEAFDLLKCNERLPSSPGCPSNESHMEYGNYIFITHVFYRNGKKHIYDSKYYLQ